MVFLVFCRLPGAQQPLGKLLTALARLPAADSSKQQQQEGGSKALKACALCGTVPSVNSGAQHGDGSDQVAKLRCCSACRRSLLLQSLPACALAAAPPGLQAGVSQLSCAACWSLPRIEPFCFPLGLLCG